MNPAGQPSMKNKPLTLRVLATLFILLAVPLLHGGQTVLIGQPSRPDDEATIRAIENESALAVLHLDYATLERIWSERLVVSTPANTLAPNRAAVFDLFRQRSGLLYSAYEKNIECIVFSDDVTIVLGAETVVPRHPPTTGESMQRRYTNIWKRENGTWRLIARQATMLPPRAS